MMRWYAVAFLLLAQSLFAQEAVRQFEQANQLFREGKFDQAATLYEQVVRNGYESPALYYNLGNAYFKMKNVSSAILYYERAKRLAPHDEDILYNLRLANLRIVDKIEPVPQMFFVDWWHALMNALSSDGWAMTAIASLWCTAICGAGFWLARSGVLQRLAFAVGLFGVVVCAVAFTGTFRQYQHEHNDLAAIIFSASVSVKSSPDARSTDLFVLHEGVKADVVDTVGEWKKIRLADGKIGWVPADGLQII